MGDPRFLNKKNITANDICNYMLSECSGVSKPVRHNYFFEDDLGEGKNDYRYYMDKNDDNDDIRELQEAQQKEWDEQEEYEQRMHDIHDKYPDFDAEGAIFRHEDPEAAERDARLDDYLNNWF